MDKKRILEFAQTFNLDEEYVTSVNEYILNYIKEKQSKKAQPLPDEVIDISVESTMFKGLNDINSERMKEECIDKLDLLYQFVTIGKLADTIVEKWENVTQSHDLLQRVIQSDDFLDRMKK